jgi:hypothetical protein
MPALKVNIIIVHPRGVVFPSAGINCFVILKLLLLFLHHSYFISFDWFHWALRQWPFYTYLHHVHVLDHGHFTDIVST